MGICVCAGEDVTCKGKRRESGKEKQGRAELGRCATRGYWKGLRHASYHNSGVMDVAGVAAWATGHEQPRAGSWLGSVQRFRQQLQRPPWLPSARAVCAHRRWGGSRGRKGHNCPEVTNCSSSCRRPCAPPAARPLRCVMDT